MPATLQAGLSPSCTVSCVSVVIAMLLELAHYWSAATTLDSQSTMLLTIGVPREFKRWKTER